VSYLLPGEFVTLTLGDCSNGITFTPGFPDLLFLGFETVPRVLDGLGSFPGVVGGVPSPPHIVFLRRCVCRRLPRVCFILSIYPTEYLRLNVDALCLKNATVASRPIRIISCFSSLLIPKSIELLCPSSTKMV